MVSRPADLLPDLTPAELERYRRHLVMPEIGVDGQRQLKAARVLLVGAGGLGSPVALYLSAAGIGRLGVVDFDAVDATNLQRQVLYGTADVGRRKVEAARERIHALNPHVEVVAHELRLVSANALGVIGEYDLVVDGADNFATRYLVNDACVLLGKINVHASVFRFEGQATVFGAPDGPCYRCIYPQPPPPGAVPSCAEGGVLGILPGLLGLVQATETVKLVTGIGEPLVGRLLLVDALAMAFRTVRLQRDPECPACGTRTLRSLVDYEAFCGVRGEAAPARSDMRTMTVLELAERLRRGDDVDVVDVREPHEWRLCRIAGARHVPLRTVPASLSSFDRARDVVLYCHTGMRSARAAQELLRAGFERVWNLEGGIQRWSEQVDPTVPQY